MSFNQSAVEAWNVNVNDSDDFAILTSLALATFVFELEGFARVRCKYLDIPRLPITTILDGVANNLCYNSAMFELAHGWCNQTLRPKYWHTTEAELFWHCLLFITLFYALSSSSEIMFIYYNSVETKLLNYLKLYLP